ncbi:MAG: response regulator transcription factor [Pseudomonadota bacterium]
MTMNNQNQSILLIEDHQDIATMVLDYLQQQGYIVDYAADGITGLHLAVKNTYDVIVLDLMLPGMDGMEVLSNLRREAKQATPILILTARDTLEDKLAGLEQGADDYLIKPFEIRELEARIKVLIRRDKGMLNTGTLTVGSLTFDTTTMEVKREGKLLKLTPIGLQILGILMRASPKIVSRRELEQEIWGDILPDSDTLRSHIYSLRKAIDRPFEKQLMHTLQNNGYRLVVDDADPERTGA